MTSRNGAEKTVCGLGATPMTGDNASEPLATGANHQPSGTRQRSTLTGMNAVPVEVPVPVPAPVPIARIAIIESPQVPAAMRSQRTTPPAPTDATPIPLTRPIRRRTEYGMAPVSPEMLAEQQREAERTKTVRRNAIKKFSLNFAIPLADRKPDMEKMVGDAMVRIDKGPTRTCHLSPSRLSKGFASITSSIAKDFTSYMLSGLRAGLIDIRAASVPEMLTEATGIRAADASPFVTDAADKVVEAIEWTVSSQLPVIVYKATFIDELRELVTMHLMAMESGNVTAVLKIAGFTALYREGWIPMGITKTDGAFMMVTI